MALYIDIRVNNCVVATARVRNEEGEHVCRYVGDAWSAAFGERAELNHAIDIRDHDRRKSVWLLVAKIASFLVWKEGCADADLADTVMSTEPQPVDTSGDHVDGADMFNEGSKGGDAPSSCPERTKATYNDAPPDNATGGADMSAFATAVKQIHARLPGWLITCGLCELTGHATIGPDYNSREHGERLHREFPPERFDGPHADFSADLAPGDGWCRVAEALLSCLDQAETAIRAAENQPLGTTRR